MSAHGTHGRIVGFKSVEEAGRFAAQQYVAQSARWGLEVGEARCLLNSCSSFENQNNFLAGFHSEIRALGIKDRSVVPYVSADLGPNYFRETDFVLARPSKCAPVPKVIKHGFAGFAAVTSLGAAGNAIEQMENGSTPYSVVQSAILPGTRLFGKDGKFNEEGKEWARELEYRRRHVLGGDFYQFAGATVYYWVADTAEGFKSTCGGILYLGRKLEPTTNAFLP